MLTFVTIWFGNLEAQLGTRGLLELFPDYIDLASGISSIQDKIAESREDRNAARNGIYDEIEKSGFDEILALFERM